MPVLGIFIQHNKVVGFGYRGVVGHWFTFQWPVLLEPMRSTFPACCNVAKARAMVRTSLPIMLASCWRVSSGLLLNSDKMASGVANPAMFSTGFMGAFMEAFMGAFCAKVSAITDSIK